jgi:hypothetical protein
MKIDNQKNTYRIWLRRLIMAIIFTLLIISVIFMPWFEGEQKRFSKYYLIIIIAVIYVGINLINYLKVPYFVFYSDQGDMIVMRYHPLSMFTSRKHSIEIPKTQFVKFEIEPFFFGTQQRLILYQHFRNKIAKYPPISLSAVEPKDRDLIIESLKRYSRS